MTTKIVEINLHHIAIRNNKVYFEQASNLFTTIFNFHKELPYNRYLIRVEFVFYAFFEKSELLTIPYTLILVSLFVCFMKNTFLVLS